jgi:hypothetical protein
MKALPRRSNYVFKLSCVIANSEAAERLVRQLLPRGPSTREPSRRLATTLSRLESVVRREERGRL